MAKSSETDKARQRLVKRAEEDPYFLGSALASYRSSRGLTAGALAEWLECSQLTLDRLALCRLPDDREGRFRKDVERIAAFGGCNLVRLAILLRETLALTALKGDLRADDRSWLVAARDRRSLPKKPKPK